MIVILHNIRSMHNVGSIFRTADGVGITKIYLCGITAAPIDEFGKSRIQIAKVSLGAENYVAWEQCKQAWRVIDQLKKEQYKIFALEQAPDAVPHSTIKLSPKQLEKTVLVVGNERNGLPDSILKRADTILEIPMHGAKESLNVSVAFGIAAFSLIQH